MEALDRILWPRLKKYYQYRMLSYSVSGILVQSYDEGDQIESFLGLVLCPWYSPLRSEKLFTSRICVDIIRPRNHQKINKQNQYNE